MSLSPHHIQIQKKGRIILEDGELIVRRDDGQEFGRFMVGDDGLIFNGGELTIAQKGDPAAIRLMTQCVDGHKGAGKFVWAVARSDGRGEEIGFVAGGLDDDVQVSSAGTPDQHRGKLQVNLRPHSATDPQPVVVWSQYRSQERFGFRTFYMAALKALGSLWVHTPSGGDATPFCGASGGGGQVGRVTRFYSDDGRYCFNVQGDVGGKIVQYDTKFMADEAQWVPVGEFRAA